MTVIELSDEQAAKLRAQAQARGLTVGELIDTFMRPNGPELRNQPVDERPIWEILASSLKDIPPEERALLPRDGASQVDHYVYGLPKRDQ